MLGKKLRKIFIMFLGELKTPQFPYEISWPLIIYFLLFQVRNLTATSGQLQLLYWCKDGGGIPYIRGDQTVSIVTSILSLAWCFTSYHATLKRGALDKDLAALFYRAVLFLANLFQILGKFIYSKYCKHMTQQIRFLCSKMN